MSPVELIPVPYTWVLALSAILLAIGTLGVLLRRNGITIFLSLEFMLNSANLAFVAFALRLAAQPEGAAAALAGQVFVFFVIGVAAAEAAVGLALFIALHRLKETIDLDRANILRSSFDLRPTVISGPATDNAVGCRFIEDQLGMPAANARKGNGSLAGIVREALHDLV